jgi:hypothetical protein
VDRLCDELADSAETFVAAFGLPDAWVDCALLSDPGSAPQEIPPTA